VIDQVLIPTLILLASIVSKAVLVQFVMSLLIAFNVISPYNNIVSAIWNAINALLDPLLNPIRRHMPHTGAIDFSPLVLIVLIQILLYFLSYLATIG
jgi:YggT family protein